MSGAAKNLIVILGLATVAFGGYFLYIQQSSSVSSGGTSAEELQNMLVKTQVFIERRKSLDAVAIDSSLFEDDRFRNLRTFTKPLENMPVGKKDPFAASGYQMEVINDSVE